MDNNESRIKALEEGHIELRKDMSDMAHNHSNLDKTLNTLMLKLDNHFVDAKEYEDMIHNVSKMVTSINMRLAGGPMERRTELDAVVKPLWDKVRHHDEKFQENSINIEKRLEARLTKHLTVAVALLSLVMGMGVYTYSQDQKNLISSIDHIQKSLDTHLLTTEGKR